MTTTPPTERDRDVTRRRRGRGAGRNVLVPPCANLARRERLEADDAAWLRHYCADLFWYPFTDQQLTMIRAIRTAIVEGGDQAIAASRGEGKSKLAERLLLKHTLTGTIKFSVLFAATGSAAQDNLQSIMGEIETNDRLLADYPEVCCPVRALENTPNRAHYMTVSGRRHDSGKCYKHAAAKFTWCGQEIIFPRVPGSPSSSAIIATRGLDSAVRGLSKRDRRPDVAVIDDPDTEETAASPEQAAKLEKRIDRGIAGLGGQKRTVARVMLTTLQNLTCVSARFTDRLLKPSWRGHRFRFLINPPAHPELWSQYVELRRADWREGTNQAHEFYLSHRREMDLGAEVANPNRFTAAQVSALQFYFDQVARTDAAAVATEFDNDPPEEAIGSESNISASMIQRQLSGLPRGVIPPGCVVLTQGIDVGKWLLHWLVRAWKADGTNYIIDYGTTNVHGAKFRSDEGLDRAVRAAILRRLDEFHAARYATEAGAAIAEPITLVDASYRTDSVYSATAAAGLGVYPIMGFGKSAGCTQANFSPAQKNTATTVRGDGWKMVRKGRVWLVEADADRWKAFEHDRWQTAADRPGCAFLFGERSSDPSRMGDDERGHTAIANHITAEIEVEEVIKGVLRRRWKPKSKENHWLDAAYYADVAANIKNIRLAGPVTANPASTVPKGAAVRTRPAPHERPSLADLAAAART